VLLFPVVAIRLVNMFRQMDRQNRVRGQNLVEFAIVLGVLVVIFLGVFDLHRVFHTYTATTNPAHEDRSVRLCCVSKVQLFTSLSRSAHGFLTILAWRYAILLFARIHKDSYGFIVFQCDYNLVTNAFTNLSGGYAWQQRKEKSY
jgi:hypothetical protein